MLHLKRYCGLVLCVLPGLAYSLEIGFESSVRYRASDNVESANSGEEQEGQLGQIQFGVFAEQRGRILQGGFTGELFSQRRMDDPDDNFDAVSEFIGAANVQITPRAFSWYFGDILGGVRAQEDNETIDDTQQDRRNVFVTGPSFEYEIDSFSRVKSRLLYVNQTQNDIELESLYNASASWEIDTDTGSTWGLQFADIYTDTPESPNADDEGDFNRLSLSGYWRRTRGLMSYDASLGGTQYTTDEETIDGVNARLAASRRLSPESTLTFAFTKDLRDQSLTTVESLIDTGSGVQRDGDGFYDETRLDLSFDKSSGGSTIGLGVSASQNDYQLLSDSSGVNIDSDLEDHMQYSAYGSYARRISTRWRTQTNASFNQQIYDNQNEDIQSVQGSAELFYRISRSFEIELGYRVAIATGVRTRTTVTETGVNLTPEDVDTTENQATIGIRWAPPTRATKELTVELKSLLQ